MTELSQIRIAVTAEDGHSFELQVFQSASLADQPVVLCLPAMGMAAKHYQDFAQKLSDNGIIALVADFRGLASSSLRASRKVNFSYHDMVKYDIAAMLTAIKEKYSGHPVFLLGHSLGGQLSVMSSAYFPGSINGLILIACGSVHYVNWPFPQNLKILFSSQLVRLIASVVGYFPGKKLGFAGTEAQKVMRDWAHFALTGKLEPINSDFDYERAFATVKLPVLAMSLEGDWFAPQKSLESLCAKLKSSSIEMQPFKKGSTSAKTLHHFGWIKHSQPVVDRIVKWLVK